MVGCFQRKSTDIHMAQELKTGIFLEKSTGEYIVLWKGQEACRYESMASFIEAHHEGMKALESNQAELLESYYRTLR